MLQVSRRAVFVLLVLGYSVWFGPAAEATNCCLWKAGDNNVVFKQCALTTNVHDGFHANDDHDIEPTDINTSLPDHQCGEDDVQVMDEAYGGTLSGWSECHRWHTVNVNCDTVHVHINTRLTNIPENRGDTFYLVCHEVGHSVGLMHTSDATSCMRQAWGSSQHIRVPHDRDHLNNLY
jgi:hypothetical protein